VPLPGAAYPLRDEVSPRGRFHGVRSARQFRARERGEAATLAELLGSRNAAEVRYLLPESENSGEEDSGLDL